VPEIWRIIISHLNGPEVRLGLLDPHALKHWELLTQWLSIKP